MNTDVELNPAKKKIPNISMDPNVLTLTHSFKKGKTGMQLIYASQLYQTFFGIFAKFETSNHTDTSCTLDAVHLRLINYKGIVNLGITQLSKPIIKPNEVRFHFKVKAFTESQDIQVYKFNKEKPSIRDTQQLVFERHLEPFSNDDVLGINQNFAYDTEFYERDGIYNRKKINRIDDDRDDANWDIDPESHRRHHTGTLATKSTTDITDQDIVYKTPDDILSLNEYIDKLKSEAGIPKTTGGRCPRATSNVVF